MTAIDISGDNITVRFEAPPGWAVVRTAPNHWQRDCERLIDIGSSGPFRRLSSAEKRDLRDSVDAMVHQAQLIGTLAIMISLAHRPETEHLSVSTLTLTLVDSSPHLADLEATRMSLEAKRGEDAHAQLHGFDTPHGPGLVLTTSESVSPQLPLAVAHSGLLAMAEAHLPISGTAWTGVANCALTMPDEEEFAGSLSARLLSTLSVSTAG